MKTYAGRYLQTACLFISTIQSKESTDAMIAGIEQIMYRKGLVIEETVIDTKPQQRQDIDRPSVVELLGKLETGEYRVLVLRRMEQICTDESQWEQFINIVEEMGVVIYSLELGDYIGNYYGIS